MLLCYCTDGVGELSLPVYPGVGNRPPRKTKLQMPGGEGGGGSWLQVKLNDALFVVPVVTRRRFL